MFGLFNKNGNLSTVGNDVLLNCNCDENKPYIFVSYSHKDTRIVQNTILQLYRMGYNIWFDEGIDPGTEWDDNIACHIEKSDIFLAFISQNYLESDNCKDELNYARDLSKEKLIVYLEEVSLPSGLQMRIGRTQAIHKYKYVADAAFYEKIVNSQVLESAKNQVAVFKSDCDVCKKAIPFQQGDIIQFGTYPQGENGENRPIDWYVVKKADDSALLLSQHALDCVQYHQSKTDVTWESCYLREWLNTNFYSRAFSDEAKQYIVASQVISDKNPEHETPLGAATIDKVFLFSINEVRSYFPLKKQRSCLPTAYAIKNGASISKGFCWWWLRTLGFCQRVATCVTPGGATDTRGMGICQGDYTIRPVICIKYI